MHETLIHPSAWKRISQKLNFHLTEFSEVRIAQSYAEGYSYVQYWRRFVAAYIRNR